MKKSLFMPLIFILLVLPIATINSISYGARDMSTYQPPTPPENPYGGTGFIMISINEFGKVLMTIEWIVSPANYSFFGASNTSDIYQDLYYAFLSIDPQTMGIGLGVGFFGNHSSNDTYYSYAIAIRDTITNYLTAIGFSLTLINSVEDVTDGTNTYYYWEYEYSTAEFIISLFYKISIDSSNSSFSEYINLNSSWEALSYNNLIARSSKTDPLQHIYYAEYAKDSVYSGNGTHTFSLKSLLGKTSLPVTTSDYYIIIAHPPDVQIDNISLYAGGADPPIVSDNIILIHVPANATLGDVRYSFTYNFSDSGGDSGDTGDVGDTTNTTNQTETSTSGGLQVPVQYIAVGIIVVIAIGIIIMKRKV